MTTNDERDPALFERAHADEDFRARLRAQFVSGAFASDGATDASAVRDDAALRPALAAEPADAAFAARLRGAFVAGALEGEASERALDDERAFEKESVVELEPAAPVFAFGRRRALAGVLALAAALALVVTIGLNRTSGWNVYNGDAAAVLVDDDRFEGSTIRPGSRACLLCTEDGNLRLGFEDAFRIELAAHTRVRMSEPRDDDGRLVLPVRLESGELVFIDRSGSRPSSVVIDTDAAWVTLRGTSVSVLPLPDGSACICVQDGEVEVESKSGAGETVVATTGQRVFVAADGAVSVSREFHDETRLANLRTACEDLAAGRFEYAEYARSWDVLERY